MPTLVIAGEEDRVTPPEESEILAKLHLRNQYRQRFANETHELEANGSGLSVRLSDGLSFPVPEGGAAHYRDHAGKEVVFGLRPEHITETRGRENGSGS